MSENHFFEAMNDINDEYVLDALNEQPTVRIYKLPKRALIIAAALLVLLATGAAWIVSSLSVDVETLTDGDFSYAIDIPMTQNYDELFELMRESGLYTEEQIAEDERILSIIEFGRTRLPQLAQEYNFDYKHLGNYLFREVDGHFAEVGSMHSDTEVLLFLHTDNEALESETYVCLILYNPETSESKWEKVIIPHTGAYATTIDVLDGWIIENIYTGFLSEIIYTWGGGGEESWLPTGEPNYPARDTYVTKDVWDAIHIEIYADEEINAIEDYWLSIYKERNNIS